MNPLKSATILWLRLMGFYLSLVAVLSLLFSLPGCASFRDHSAAIDLVLSQVTMRYIEQASPADRAARAHRVHDTAERVKNVAAKDQISIADLAKYAAGYLPDTLSPADRSLALSLIQVAAQELQKKIGEGKIPDDARVTVLEVLSTIENAADVYVGGPE